MSDLPALTLLNAVRAERDAALARAEKLIADVDDLINECDALSSRLREAEGHIHRLLMAGCEDGDARRFLPASPTPTEEGP